MGDESAWLVDSNTSKTNPKTAVFINEVEAMAFHERDALASLDQSGPDNSGVVYGIVKDYPSNRLIST
jgi:hypothetical protein